MSLTGNAESGYILRGKLSNLDKINGLSAYEVAVVNGFSGTEEEWLESLKGKDGKDGVVGKDGADGYTPVKGVDYFDGADGKDGVDGKDGADGKDGNSIQSIDRTAGNGAPGTTDTYTVTLTDGSTSTFDVYNGADGTGAGDMTATVYDPNGKKTDIYKYVDDAVSAGGGGGGVAGVSSFNGRAGAVTPQNGDYTAAMVGADASGSAANALNDAKAYTDGKISAIPTPDVSGQIGAHNADNTAHGDIRAAIPSKTSDLTNDSGFITNSVESDFDVSGSLNVSGSSCFHDDVVVEGCLFTANEENVYLHSGDIASYAAPPIAFGTADVTAGSASSYPEGTLYVVIE